MHRLFAAVIFYYLPLRYGLTSSASPIASVALRCRSGGMVMKRLLLSGILLLTVMVSPSGSFGVDFQKGMDAAQRGDFAAALKEWKPLAEQGDAHTQYNLGVMYQEGRGSPRTTRLPSSGTPVLPNKELPMPSSIWVLCTKMD